MTDFEDLIVSLNLPDPDDRHVLVAAIVAKANVIVTANLKDFPVSVLSSFGIEAQHPDDFIADLIDLRPLQVIEAIKTLQGRLKNPSINFDEYMEILMRQGLCSSVSMLCQLQDEGWN